MTATNLLKAKLIEMGFNQEDIAIMLNISRQSFFNKLHNRTEFKASEIELLCSVLKIENKDAYFFCCTNSQNG